HSYFTALKIISVRRRRDRQRGDGDHQHLLHGVFLGGIGRPRPGIWHSNVSLPTVRSATPCVAVQSSTVTPSRVATKLALQSPVSFTFGNVLPRHVIVPPLKVPRFFSSREELSPSLGVVTVTG